MMFKPGVMMSLRAIAHEADVDPGRLVYCVRKFRIEPDLVICRTRMFKRKKAREILRLAETMQTKTTRR